MSKYTFNIKPSASVEGYYNHHCERHLLYGGIMSGTGKLFVARKEFGLDEPKGTSDKTAIEAGSAWEKEVIDIIDSDPDVFFIGLNCQVKCNDVE